MWFFQIQNNFGLKFGQMAIFQVLYQKHVVFPNSKSFGAEILTNGDIQGALSETCGFSKFKSFWAEIWTNGDFPGALSETCGFSKLKIIMG